MALLEARQRIKPIEYQWAWDANRAAVRSRWDHEDGVSWTSDIKNWKTLSESDKEVISGILKGFTLIENVVGCYWSRIAEKFPVPEIAAMARTFSAQEVVHAIAYQALEDNLGLDTYEAFTQDATAVKKLNDLLDFDQGNLENSLAIFSGAVEGISLFSSFAVLQSYCLDGKFNGMRQILSWSQADECVEGNTEVLTKTGWKLIKNISEEDVLAQYSTDNGEISFAKPSRIIKKQYSGKMLKFSGQRYSANVTENHDMVCRWDNGNGLWQKKKAKDLSINPKMLIPSAGIGIGEKVVLSSEDKLKIAIQADGSIQRETKSTITIVFSITKKRKQKRLEYLLNECGIAYNKYAKGIKGAFRYSFVLPSFWVECKTSFSWVELDKISAEYARAFVYELLQWDGSQHGKYSIGQYYSTNQLCISQAQAIACLAGYSTSANWVVDDRKETYKDYCKLTFLTQSHARMGRVEKEEYEFSGLVYCATMPKGTLIIRDRKENVSVVGNCLHSLNGIRLLNTLRIEYPERYFDKKLIRAGFHLVVANEMAFIHQIFKGEDLPNITLAQAVNYIRVLANEKLQKLIGEDLYELTPSMKECGYAVKSWMDPLSGLGATTNDFFSASRNGTAYSSSINQDFENVDLEELWKKV